MNNFISLIVFTVLIYGPGLSAQDNLLVGPAATPPKPTELHFFKPGGKRIISLYSNGRVEILGQAVSPGVYKDLKDFFLRNDRPETIITKTGEVIHISPCMAPAESGEAP